MKVLLGVDGSRHSKKAAAWLVRHVSALRSKPRIILLNVQPPIPYRGVRRVVGVSGMERFYREEGKAALAPAAAILRRAGVAYTALALVGDPASEIVALATRRRMDLIAMGSHGAGALRGLLLGSVVSKVVAHTKIPVLVVR